MLHSLLFKIWRPGRVKRFRECLRPQFRSSVLDLGGTPAFWEPFEPFVEKVDLLNLNHGSLANYAGKILHTERLLGMPKAYVD